MKKWYAILSFDILSIMLFLGLAAIILWRWETYDCYKPYNVWLLGFAGVMATSRGFRVIINYSQHSEYTSLVSAICFILKIVPFLTIWTIIGLVWLYQTYKAGESCGHYSIERFAIPFFVFESLVHLLIYYADCYKMVHAYVGITVDLFEEKKWTTAGSSWRYTS
jgi:hypothetical protein